MRESIFIKAPAKINLSLDIIGRRPDGFHLVEMVMQTISLCDHITLEAADGAIHLHCSHPFVPAGSGNIVWKAAHLLKSTYGSAEMGAVITVEKHIPVSAGLGGGSSDAAAVLKGLNELWDLRLSPAQLAELGLRLGADVPFCLQGGTALARGIGEKLTPVAPPPSLWVVLLKPNMGVSTGEVYREFVQGRVRTRPDTQRLVSALEAGDYQAMAESMANVLESVTFRRFPILRRLKQKALELGALAAMMSGSGPTIFALTPEYKRAAAIYNRLRHQVEFAHITTFWEE